jgi:hypothetical protein
LRLQAGRSKGGAAAKGNLKQFKAAAETPAEHRLKPSAGPAEMVQPEGGAGAYNRLTSGSPPADDRLTDRLTDRLNTGLSATSDELLLTAAPPGPQVVAKKPREPKKPVDPRFGPLVGRLKASFADLIGAGYDFTDADGGALKHLLGKADDDEIDRRWRSGLSADQFSAKCATVLQLAQRWNELAVVRATSPAAARREEPTAPRPEGRVFL